MAWTSSARTGLVYAYSLLALCCAVLIAVPAAAQSVSNGWRIIFDQRAGNCVACHSVADASGKKTGIQSTFAPALDAVASRYSAEVLRQWVVDARKINPDTLMPPFGSILSQEHVNEVLAALLTLR